LVWLLRWYSCGLLGYLSSRWSALQCVLWLFPSFSKFPETCWASSLVRGVGVISNSFCFAVSAAHCIIWTRMVAIYIHTGVSFACCAYLGLLCFFMVTIAKAVLWGLLAVCCDMSKFPALSTLGDRWAVHPFAQMYYSTLCC